MTRFTSLLWKEWREAQPYLWVGLGLFLVLPVIGGLEPLLSGGRFALVTSPWVLALGGVLAVLAGVGVTAGDLRPKVADFWQSRPIGVRRWLAGKYAVGLGAVLVACAVPVTAELLFAHHPDDNDAAYLVMLPFFWTAAFSLAFAAGCVVDRPAHAAVVGLVGLLLLYVLPVVLSPLAWLSVSDVGYGQTLDGLQWDRHRAGHPVVFAAGLTAASAAAVAVSAAAVRRSWRVASGRRLLYAFVAAAVLLLFTSAAFQLGTNLPVLQRVALPDDEWIRTIHVDGDHGYVITIQSTDVRADRQRRPWHNVAYRYRPLAVGPAGLTLGPPVDVASTLVNAMSGYQSDPSSTGNLAYGWDATDVPGSDDLVEVVVTATERRPGGSTRSVPLWRVDRTRDGLSVFAWADRLYAWGDGRLATFDLTPPRPTAIAVSPSVPLRRRRPATAAGLGRRDAGDVPPGAAARRPARGAVDGHGRVVAPGGRRPALRDAAGGRGHARRLPPDHAERRDGHVRRHRPVPADAAPADRARRQPRCDNRRGRPGVRPGIRGEPRAPGRRDRSRQPRPAADGGRRPLRRPGRRRVRRPAAGRPGHRRRIERDLAGRPAAAAADDGAANRCRPHAGRVIGSFAAAAAAGRDGRNVNAAAAMPEDELCATFADGGHTVTVRCAGLPGVRRFTFDSDAPAIVGLHTHGGSRTVEARSSDPYADTGSPVLDGLFALAIAEAHENAVQSICDAAFQHGQPIPLAAYETGAKWHYVWTRDLAYSVDLGLAGLDADRCVSSLLFKTSGPKPGVDVLSQVLQDTGSGGSYPVSTDRVVWAIAADRLVRHLTGDARAEFVRTAYPLLRNTAEQDRQLVYDPADGLYRGEQSFLDWREQTYPLWTAADTVAIGLSKATGTNVAHVALLRTAAAFAGEVGDGAGEARYGAWADALIVSLNKHLWDEDAGLYAAYLLTESRWPVRVRRYDLLSQALAILWGVASPARGRRMLGSYPTGPHGPPVVWPQEQAVPIYHNHAIWPFVTAYWARAAAVVGHGPAVAAGLASLVRGAAVNLSNMENMDLVTGAHQATVHGISGPVISSQRQLWSVAGFVSVVRDVLFGLDVSPDGAVTFRPCVTPAVRARFFGPGDAVSVHNLTHLGCRHDVTLHLPTDVGGGDVPYAVSRATCNGEAVGGPVRCAASVNRWDVWLTIGTAAAAAAVPTVTDFADVRRYFGPRQPTCVASVVGGRLMLRFGSDGPGPVTYTVYRDGAVVADGLTVAEWADDRAGPHAYAVSATFPESGLQSHLSAETSTAAVVEQPADAAIRPSVDGVHVLRLRYVNGGAPVNTGITCGVRRWAVLGDDGGVVASGHVILPHTAGATLRSSPMVVTLSAGRAYTLRLETGGAAINMTYFDHNRMYTAHAGGGDAADNAVTVVGLSVAAGG